MLKSCRGNVKCLSAGKAFGSLIFYGYKLLSIICLRLVFLRKAISGDISLKPGLTSKTCQFFSSIDLIYEIGILRFTSCEVLFSGNVISSTLALWISFLSVAW